jgi:hypothetical protein
MALEHQILNPSALPSVLTAVVYRANDSSRFDREGQCAVQPTDMHDRS